jgi:hypothetical protein
MDTDKLAELETRFESELDKAKIHVEFINENRRERRRRNLPDIGSSPGRGMMACFGAMPIVDGCTRP